MAILFHCPHCSSAIRVPDTAAGKQGTCPTCAKKLLVPQVDRGPVPDATPPEVEPPRGSTSVAPEPAAPLNFGDVPSAPSVPPTPEAPFPGPGIDIPVSTGRTGRRRKSSSGTSLWLVPLALGSALVSIVLYLMRTPELRLEGALSSQALASDAVVPAQALSIDPEVVDDEMREAVVKRLEESPLSLLSSSMRVEFRAERGRITVQVESTTKSEFVVLTPPADAAMQTFLRTNARLLEESREQELRPALKAFFEEYSADSASDDAAHHRDGVGLASLTKGLGYCTEAVVGTTGYRCVAEDAEGRLYFLLPPGTTQWEWRGRKLANGTTPFPGRYTVSVVPHKEPEPKKKGKPSGPAMDDGSDQASDSGPRSAL